MKLPFNPVATGFVNAQRAVVHKNLLQHFKNNRFLTTVRQVVYGEYKGVYDVVSLKHKQSRAYFKSFGQQKLHSDTRKQASVFDLGNMPSALILDSRFELSLIIASKLAIVSDILTDNVLLQKLSNLFSHFFSNNFIHNLPIPFVLLNPNHWGKNTLTISLDNVKIVTQCLVKRCCNLYYSCGMVQLSNSLEVLRVA